APKTAKSRVRAAGWYPLPRPVSIAIPNGWKIKPCKKSVADFRLRPLHFDGKRAEPVLAGCAITRLGGAFQARGRIAERPRAGGQGAAPEPMCSCRQGREIARRHGRLDVAARLGCRETELGQHVAPCRFVILDPRVEHSPIDCRCDGVLALQPALQGGAKA